MKNTIKTIIFISYQLKQSFILNELIYYGKNGIRVCICTFDDVPEVLKQYESLSFVRLDSNRQSQKSVFIRYFRIIVPLVIKEIFSNIRNKKYLFSFKAEFSNLLNQAIIAEQIDSCIADKRKVVLLSYWFYYEALALSLLCDMKGGMVYYSRAHAFDIYEEHRDFKVIPFRLFQLRNVMKVFPVSEYGTKYLKDKYPTYRDRFETFYIGSFNDDCRINVVTDDTIRVVSCGSVQYRKRTNLIHNLLKRVSESRSVIWTHIGDGPEFEEFFGHIEEVKNMKIAFIKHLENTELLKLYRNNPFSFFISLSDNEGIPVSIMEAISFGMPVISTDVGGCSEIVNPITGLLIPCDYDETELVRMVIDFAASDFQSLPVREKIVGFWNSVFNAELNYSKMVQKLKLKSNVWNSDCI